MLAGTNVVLVFALLGAVILLARDAWDYRRAYKEEAEQEKAAAQSPLVVVHNANFGPPAGGDKSA